MMSMNEQQQPQQQQQQQQHHANLLDHHLTVVLFAKGRGSDATSYRPNRHETQWWNRRDALVRCVASFLFGPSPSSPSSNNNNNKTLVILFDEDWSRMQMTYTSSSSSSSSSFLPTEQNVVALWKQAALAVGTVVSHGGGLSCQLILPPLSLSSDPLSSSLSLPPLSGMDSKRDILVHLQKTCSIDFLRIHGLNSTMNVILRKHNKKSILEIWHKWTTRHVTQLQHQQESDGINTANREQQQKNASILKAIFQEILWQQQQQQQLHSTNVSKNNSDGLFSSSSMVQQQQQPLLVVAGTLHESHDSELPCWDTEDHFSSTSLSSFVEQTHQHKQHPTIMHVCLFLGAVRDMYPYEYDCLHQVVQEQEHHQHQQQQMQSEEAPSSCATGAMIRTVPVIRIRLGPVAEFTSKILTVLAFHHATGRLGMAIQKLLYQQNAAAATAETSPKSHPNDNSNNHHDSNGNHNTPVASKAGTKRPRRTDGADSFNNTPDNGTMATTSHPPAAAFTSSCSFRRRGRCSCLQLEVVCLLPTLESCNVTTDLNQRSRALWCLVRCTVTALWRSRLASSSSSSTATISTTESPLTTTTTFTLVFCDGTILRLRQDEIVKAMAEQHQAAPCEYQILAAIEKQLKDQQQQQQQQCHANQKVNRKATTTTRSTEFWKACASKILAAIIQNDDNGNDDDKTSNGSFQVLDLTSSMGRSTTGDASISTMPSDKQGDHQHIDADADDEETRFLDLTKHIYSVSAESTNLKNSGNDIESITTIALISIDDNVGFHSTSASTTMDKNHPQQQHQQHDNKNMMAIRMRNGFVQACRYCPTDSQSPYKIPVYTCPTFLTTDISTCTATKTISSSISLPPTASAAATATTHSNSCYYNDACMDKQAAMTTLLQHFLYQNRRLVPLDEYQAAVGPTCNPVRDNYVNNGDKKRIKNFNTKADDATDDKSSLHKAKKAKKKEKKKKRKKEKRNGEE